MSEWLNADLINALGIAIATVVGAASTWQNRQIKNLKIRIEDLEAQAADDRMKFRHAVIFIRQLMRYIDELKGYLRAVAPSSEPPTAPHIPEDLEEEI